MDKENLKNEIEIELTNLERLANEMKRLIDKLTAEPDFIETRAAGSIIHDFYCGVEKIFERIAMDINGELPKGEDWHTELLLQMTHPIEGFRKAVISQELFAKLKEYLRFRHLFRNIYGFELKWELFKDLTLSLDELLNGLRGELEEFLI